MEHDSLLYALSPDDMNVIDFSPEPALSKAPMSVHDDVVS